MNLSLQTYNTRFLSQLKQTGRVSNDDAERYDVRIEPVEVATGAIYWQAIGVHHLTPEENTWSHNVYIEALDEAGNRVTSPTPYVGWTWAGRHLDEEARPAALDKGAGEPAGNIPMGAGQHLSVWILGSGAEAQDPSDRVVNLHTNHSDERTAAGELWNSIGHHSFYVVFQRTRKATGGMAQPDDGEPVAIPTPTPTPQPVEPLPGGASVEFRAEPDQVNAGQQTALRWDVESVREVYFDGQGVTGHESRTVTPTATTTYTLHVVFRDGSTRDFTARVTIEVASPQPQQVTPGATPVEPAPLPGVTKSPTVRLTAENLAHLKRFPRPQNDNGRGLHFHLDLSDYNIGRTVERLETIRAKWTLIYAPDELQTERAARACWNAGIMPVIRIAKDIDEAFDPVPYVKALQKVGAPPYVQIYNEPSDSREYGHDERPANWLAMFAHNWANKAAAVFDAGGYPGLQVLEKEELDAAIDAVAAIGRNAGDKNIWTRAFFSLHNYGVNHPPRYPYDIGGTVFDLHDGFESVLRFLAYATWIKERLGFVIPFIGGEGGWLHGEGNNKDPRYPKIEDDQHARYHHEMYEWFRTGILSNGEPLPDYLFSITAWKAGSGERDAPDWWDSVLGDKTQTIKAMQSIPEFVRKFSWDQA